MRATIAATQRHTATIACKHCTALAVGALLLAAAPGLGAISATADISTLQTSAPFTYTITLHNTGDTNIGTFWFAWTATPAEYDFLPTSPTVTGSPGGWISPISHNFFPGDGYGIEWYSVGSGLIAPGDTSSAFKFTTNDSPAQLAGDAFFPGFKVTNSAVYTGFPFSDPGFSLVATVPEPAIGSLVAAGLVGFAAARRRRWHRVRNQALL